MKYFSLIVWAIIVLSSCADTTTVGSELIEDDLINVVNRSDFALTAKTLTTKPVNSYGPNITPQVMYAGDFDNPIFGKIESKFYFQFRYNNTLTPNYEGAELDSMILTLDVLPQNILGDSTAAFDIEIYRLLSDLTGLSSIPSDTTFQVSDDPVAALYDVNLAELDSIKFKEPDGSNVSFFNVIRLPLSEEFSKELFENTDVFGSQNNLTKVFNGFMLRASNGGNGLASFYLGNGNNARNNTLKVYYKAVTDSDTTYRENVYQLGFVKPMIYSNNLNGATVESQIDKKIEGDDVGYLQGFNGPVVEIDLSDVLSLNDEKAQLNHATLDLTVAYDQFFDRLQQPAQSVGLYMMNSSGDLVPIADLALGIVRNQRERIFGGNRLEPERDFFKYKMNITAYLKTILESENSPKAYLAILNRELTPARTIIYGPEHSVYPMKLNVTYTKP